MSDIFVAPNDREGFEESFIDLHPALGLKATSNSGAYWGDGDARPQATRRDAPTFAVEMKTRKSSKLTPKASEYAKACGEDGTGGQLAKFDSQAIRMLAVYSLSEETYAISIPEQDAEQLRVWLGSSELGEREYVTRSGKKLYYNHLTWMGWKDLYERIESQFK